MQGFKEEKKSGGLQYSQDIKEFINYAKNFNIDVSPSQIEQILIYLEELQRWNQKINLISAKNVRELLIRHVLDSLVPSRFLEEKCALLDAGTGAGFPGIPLKILRPDLFIVLVESRRKKVAFNQFILNKLGLLKIEAIWSRIEDPAFIQRFIKHRFDGIISRAAMPDEIIFKAGESLLNERGQFLLMKGSLNQSQKKAIEKIASRYDRKIFSLNPYSLPGYEKEKNILLI